MQIKRAVIEGFKLAAVPVVCIGVIYSASLITAAYAIGLAISWIVTAVGIWVGLELATSALIALNEWLVKVKSRLNGVTETRGKR